MTTFLLSAWRFIASSRIVQGAITVGGLIAYHAFAKWQAGRAGAAKERAEAELEAYKEQAKHSGDINTARQKLDEQQQERREREKGEDPRERFSRDPFE